MRRPIAWFAVCLLLLMTALPALAASFSDTRGHWAERYVQEAADKGLIGGNPDGTFGPDAPLTRAAFVTLIARALKLPAATPATPTFADTASHWVVKQGYLEAAVRAGIVKASDYGTAFGPDQPIPREEIAVMAVRALGIDAWSQQPTGSDAGAITAARRAQVAAAQDLGIVTGFPDGSFQPRASATRAQAAVIILRVAERLDRLARPVLPAGYEEHCSPAALAAESSVPDSTAQWLEEAAAALGIVLPDPTPAAPPVCEGSDNPQLRLVQLIIDEAEAARAAGDASRAERLRAEGLSLLRSGVLEDEVSRSQLLVAMVGPKLAAAGTTETPEEPPKGRREAPKSVADHLAAGRQASDLGDEDLAQREMEAAQREYSPWAEKELRDMRRQGREGGYDELDLNDAYNIGRTGSLLALPDVAQDALDLWNKIKQDLFDQALKRAACPPTDEQIEDIFRTGRRASSGLSLERSRQIMEQALAKLEQHMRSKAQMPNANLSELGAQAAKLGMRDLAAELERSASAGKNFVKPPQCEETWSGTITVVRTAQAHIFSSSPDEGTETSDIQTTHTFTLTLKRGEVEWRSEVSGTGSGTWVLREDDMECGPSVTQTDTSWKLSGLQTGGSLSPVNLSLVVQEDGQYSFSFSVPRPFGMLEGQTTLDVSGGCFPEHRTDRLSIPVDETELMPGFDVQVSDDAGKPNPGYLKAARPGSSRSTADRSRMRLPGSC